MADENISNAQIVNIYAQKLNIHSGDTISSPITRVPDFTEQNNTQKKILSSIDALVQEVRKQNVFNAKLDSNLFKDISNISSAIKDINTNTKETKDNTGGKKDNNTIDENKSYGAQQDIARMYDLMKNTFTSDFNSIARSMVQTIIHNYKDPEKMMQQIFPGSAGTWVSNVIKNFDNMTNIVGVGFSTIGGILKTISGWGVLFITVIKFLNDIFKSQADLRKNLIDNTGGLNSPILTSKKSNAELLDWFKKKSYDEYRDQIGWDLATNEKDYVKNMLEVTKTLPTRFLRDIDTDLNKATTYGRAGDLLSRMKAMHPESASAIDQAFGFLMRKEGVKGDNPLTAIAQTYAAINSAKYTDLTANEFLSTLNTMNNDFRLLGGTTLGNIALLEKFGDEINSGTISVSDFAKGAKSLKENTLEKNVAVASMAVDYALKNNLRLPKDFMGTTDIGRGFYLNSYEMMKRGGESIKNVLASTIQGYADVMSGFGADRLTKLANMQMVTEKLLGFKLSADFLASKNVTDLQGNITERGKGAIWAIQSSLNTEKQKILRDLGIEGDINSTKNIAQLQAKQALYSVTTTTQLDRIINYLRIFAEQIMLFLSTWVGYLSFGNDGRIERLRGQLKAAEGPVFDNTMPKTNDSF